MWLSRNDGKTEIPVEDRTDGGIMIKKKIEAWILKKKSLKKDFFFNKVTFEWINVFVSTFEVSRPEVHRGKHDRLSGFTNLIGKY